MKRFFPYFVGFSLMLSMLACSFGPGITFRFPGSDSAAVSTLIPPALTEPARLPATLPVRPDAVQLDSILPQIYSQLIPGIVSIQVTSELGGGQGSGFVYNKQGFIITNFHVVEGAQTIEVDFQSGLKVRGEIVSTDLDSDLAVLKVNVKESDLVPLELGDSDALQVGQSVIALGAPFGLSGTMTLGIVSAKGRALESKHTTAEGSTYSSGDIIQTDASINPGNSGGPLVNLAGRVIGINRAIRTTSSNADGQPVNTGIGFAVPINIVKKVLPTLLAGDTYDYPYMGLSFPSEDLNLDELEALGLTQSSGAYISNVTPNGPAFEAGLRAGSRKTAIPNLLAGGDYIIGVDGRPVKAFSDLIGYVLSSRSPGDKIVLTIIRDGGQKEVTLTLGKRP
jgi:S1-C subfamily serine protease